MGNHLLKLLALNCLMDFCLSASIVEAPSTIPACFPGSSDVNDCMIYTCDENGQWQEFEFKVTDECCMKSYHPSCAERGIINSGLTLGVASKGQASGVTLTEFIVTTESPSTTTPTPACDLGRMKAQDCRLFVCQDGQWQVGEFTATKECCLQTYHPKCLVMGFTTTEFEVTTESPSTTTPSAACESGLSKAQDCRISFCQDGQWIFGEFTATKECCLQTYHPMCQVMGYTNTGQVSDITTKGQASSITTKGQAMSFTSTETMNTTVVTTTPTPECAPGSDSVINCTIFVCWNGEWEPFEFTATEECCLKELHPRCILFGFSGEEEGLTSPVSSASTTSPEVECLPGSSRVQECGIYLCESGQWLLFEFFASDECCANEFHPECAALNTTPQGAALNTTPQDDSAANDWPLTDSDSSEEFDILLVHLPLLPVVLFPVTSNDGPMNSQKEKSDVAKNSNRAAHHQD